MPRSAAVAARLIMREKPGADSGAPRSETNTNGDCALSRWCRRNSRISRPLRGCVAGVPFLALRMCRVAVLKSICSQRRSTYVCPAGEKLGYHYTTEENGLVLRRYWTNVCQSCFKSDPVSGQPQLLEAASIGGLIHFHLASCYWYLSECCRPF